MSKFHQPGDTQKVLCHTCHEVGIGEYRYHEVTLQGRKHDLLVLVCKKCNEVVAIPEQSLVNVKLQELSEWKNKMGECLGDFLTGRDITPSVVVDIIEELKKK
jgi:RNase P subunit RPR2